MTNETPNYVGGNNKKKNLLVTVLIIAAIILIVFLIVRCARLKKTQEESQALPNLTDTPVVLPEPEKPKMIKSPFGEFNPEQPKPTMPLSEEKAEEMAQKSDVIQLEITPTGFLPREFTVEAGKTVSLLIKASNASHVFAFEDPLLSAATTGITRDEIRGFSFLAPTKIGDYVFFCTESGHRERGETGVMHVR